MKIAFLFLTIDNVRIPKIWEYYFKDNYDKLNIYCHPKNPEKVTIEWQKRNIINNLTNTKWGHFTNAILNLFKAALKNKDNKKFMIVSESCLPIKSFNLFYNMLSKDNIKTSYINITKFNSYNINNSKIPQEYLKDINLIKHSGWFCLSRHHVKKLLINKNIYKFNKVIAGDEHILSLIYSSDNIKNVIITYDNWDYKIKFIEDINNKLFLLYQKKELQNTNKYDKQILELRIKKGKLARHPKTYDKLTKSEIKLIKNSKSFFFRKFSIDSSIVKYYKQLL